jgi:selenide,water dikinase
VAGKVIMGGADVMAAAGCVIVGGHSIDDAEPTYGFAVTGLVDVRRLMTNAGGRAGDRLLLTKPLGSGIVTTAHKRDSCPPGVLKEMVDIMTTLNDLAGAALFASGAHAATDVTGFGLLGHLREMADASGVGATIDAGAVPLVDGAEDLLAQGFFSGGSQRNLDDVASRLSGDIQAAPMLADAQTSGGLLVAIPPQSVAAYQAEVASAVEIGELTDDAGRLHLR